MSEEKLQSPCKECKHYRAEPTPPCFEGKCCLMDRYPVLLVHGDIQMKADEGCFNMEETS